MHTADPSSSDSPFADHLAELDDQRRFGAESNLAGTWNELEPTELDQRLHRGEECLDFLDKVLNTTSGSVPEGTEPGATSTRRIGRFTIVRELGRGGFGVVYLARDPVLGREVALKLPRPEVLLTPAMRGRFLREARAAAALDHPGLVPVHEAGEIGPLIYIVSTFCDGPDLREWLKNQTEPVPPRLAARLVAEIALAVQHAHDRGVLHRDLKPSNILLHGSTPRVTDFGLAKFVEQESEETRTGLPIGSPSYMAPEQAAGSLNLISATTDVYALGAVLYELLVGQPPFRGESSMDTMRRVLVDEPVRPRLLRPGLPRDLETIVLKCLGKSPSSRYSSARDLAEDLDRYLAGKPILARPASLVKRARSWAVRRPASALLLAMFALMAVGLVAAAAWRDVVNRRHSLELDRALRRAEEHAIEAEGQRQITQRQLDAATLRVAGDALEKGEMERAQEILGEVSPDRWRFAWSFLRSRAVRDLELLWNHETRLDAMTLAPDAQTLAVSDDRGNILLSTSTAARPCMVLSGHQSRADELVFSSDGRLLASAAHADEHSSGEVLVWDVSTGRLVKSPEGFQRRSPLQLGFLAQDRYLGVVSVGRDGTPDDIRIFDLANQTEPARAIRRIETIVLGGLESSGRLIFAATRPDRLDLIEPVSNTIVQSLQTPSPATQATLSPRGRILAAKCGHDVVVWDLSTGRQQARFSARVSLYPFFFSPDGSKLAVVTTDGLVRICDLTSDRELTIKPVKAGSNQADLKLAFSPNSRRLAVSGRRMGESPGQLTLWEVTTGRRLATAPGRVASLPLGFTDDGRSVLSVAGRSLRVWHPDPPMEHDRASHPPEAWSLAFTPDGRSLASGGDDNVIRLWDAATAEPRGILSGHDATVSALAFHPNGRLLASASLGDANNLTLWDMEHHREAARLGGHHLRIRAIAFSPDGTMLASGSWDRTIRLWEMGTSRELGVLSGHDDNVRDVAFSPDGRTLASAGEDRRVLLWDVPSRRRLLALPCPHEATSVRFSPDGTTLAWTDREGTLTVRDMARDATRFSRSTEDGEVFGVTYNPDGTTLATGGTSGVVRLWDAQTGLELLSLPCKARVNGLAFSPDGKTLAACDLTGTVYFWRATMPPP